MTDGKIVELGNSPSLASGKQISLSGNCQQKICGAPRKQLKAPFNFGWAHKAGSESGGNERKLKFTFGTFWQKMKKA